MFITVIIFNVLISLSYGSSNDNKLFISEDNQISDTDEYYDLINSDNLKIKHVNSNKDDVNRTFQNKMLKDTVKERTTGLISNDNEHSNVQDNEIKTTINIIEISGHYQDIASNVELPDGYKMEVHEGGIYTTKNDDTIEFWNTFTIAIITTISLTILAFFIYSFYKCGRIKAADENFQTVIVGPNHLRFIPRVRGTTNNRSTHHLP